MLKCSLFILVITVNYVLAEIGCRNETGDIVDWYILYKLPVDSSSTDPLRQNGEAYAYLDSEDGTWVGSAKSVEDKSSYMATTYSQVIKGRKNLAYLIYNDQLPHHGGSSYYGHTKGILATDGKDGFWLVHSVPRFPEEPDKGSYDYPENGKVHGQSLLCITFSFDQLAKIVGLFQYTRPNVYSRRSIAAIKNLPVDLQGFFSGRHKYIRQPPWNTTVQITSKLGQNFTAFGKHTKFGDDLYDALVAPSLNSSLYVQSWQVGRGGPLDPDCDDEFQVYNVEAMKLNYGNRTTAVFLTTNDHSKWAAAINDTAPWVCVGDINRMHSQFKRGGGTVCMSAPNAWKAYIDVILYSEGCSV